MNAPLPEHIRRALNTVTLDDKYSLDVGRAFMSGVQALVKLPMLQRQRDALQGKYTAGFISGYRGSPLGTYDQAVFRSAKHRLSTRGKRGAGRHRAVGYSAVGLCTAGQ
jgi:indolepyruvate ferredoxin oxidoreductase